MWKHSKEIEIDLRMDCVLRFYAYSNIMYDTSIYILTCMCVKVLKIVHEVK